MAAHCPARESTPPGHAELAHWHPLLLSRELGARPRRVRLHGRDLVLFRVAPPPSLLGRCGAWLKRDGAAQEDGAASGGGVRAGGGDADGVTVAALPDRCGHRAMRLSAGRVVAGRLVCPYHGWGWSAAGCAQVPASPSAAPRMESFEAIERDGAIWVRGRGSTSAFPRIEMPGFHCFARERTQVAAPLELVLDNFIEVEHTATTHLVLGYALDKMAAVATRTALHPDRVEVWNRGVQKPLPRPLLSLYGLRPGDLFVDEWTTYFSPVHTVYHQYHEEPGTGRLRPYRQRAAVFFNPVDAQRTELIILAYTNLPPWARAGTAALLYPLTRLLLREELRRDIRMIEQLADQSIDLRGSSLGRFDKALVACRQRIARLYRGASAEPSRTVPRAASESDSATESG